MKRLPLIIFAALFAAMSHAQDITVTVSIPPQKYIIDRISQGKIRVNVMIPKGSDPHTFSPKAAQIKQLADSILYLAIGFPFEESLLSRISQSHKNLTVIKTDEGIALSAEDEGYISAAQTGGKNAEKTDGELDPHIWTSPKEMLKIAENSFNAILKIDPVNRAVYEKGYNALTEDIRAADGKFAALFQNSYVSKKFIAYHPAWSYFARHYGLEQYAVETDGKPPKAKELKTVIEKAKAENIKVFLIQPQHSAGLAAGIAKELGVKPVTIDILNEDWIDTMTRMYAAFAGALPSPEGRGS